MIVITNVVSVIFYYNKVCLTCQFALNFQRPMWEFFRPDTSWRQLPQLPLHIALMPLEFFNRNLHFPLLRHALYMTNKHRIIWTSEQAEYRNGKLTISASYLVRKANPADKNKSNT